MEFYRIQEIGFSWAQTKNHKSSNWGEENTDGSAPECGNGICATNNADDLIALIDTWFGLNSDELENYEVLVFHGSPIRNVGDGWLVEPISEIERMNATEFVEQNS